MRPVRFISASTSLLMLAFVIAAPGCGDDDEAATHENNLECSGHGGPVAGPEDAHCIDATGRAIAQAIGACTTGAPEGAAGGGGASGTDAGPDHGGAAGAADQDHGGAGGDHDHADGDHAEEEHDTLFGSQAADDDCKYDVSFEASCVEVNKSVTFTLTLNERATGRPAHGAKPSSPEVFLEEDPTHISPSVSIKAPEDPDGTYAIGPIRFDRSGRWVVRFHFFESCSDVPEDSPHGHVAFYIDVP